MNRSWIQNVAAPNANHPMGHRRLGRGRSSASRYTACVCATNATIQTRQRPGARGLAHDLKRLGFAQPRAAPPTPLSARTPARPSRPRRLPHFPAGRRHRSPPRASPWPSFRGRRRKWSPGGTTIRNPGPTPPGMAAHRQAADEGRAILHPQRLDVTQPVLVGRLARDQHHDPPAQHRATWPRLPACPASSCTRRCRRCCRPPGSLPAMASASARGRAPFLWRGRREIVHVDPVLHRAQATAGVVRAHQAAPGMFADADHAIRGQASRNAAPRLRPEREVCCVYDRRTPTRSPMLASMQSR